MNRVMLYGRLTADPEIKMTQGNKQILRFALAVQRKKNVTDFFDIVAWDTTATLIARMTGKGSRIIIDGRLETGTWTDKNGNKRKDVYVVCTDFTAVDYKETVAAPDRVSGGTPNYTEITDDDPLPF